MLKLNIIDLVKEWVKEAVDPDILKTYINFLNSCTKYDILHEKMLELNVQLTVLDKVEQDYSSDIKIFETMLKFFNSALIMPDHLLDFIKNVDAMKRTLTLGNLNSDNLHDHELIIEILDKIYNSSENIFDSLLESCQDELVYLFSNIVGKRCFQYLYDWFSKYNDLKIWEHDFLPENTNNVKVNKLHQREKDILDKVLVVVPPERILEQASKLLKESKQAGNLVNIDYFCASIVCYLQTSEKYDIMQLLDIMAVTTTC